MLVFIINQWIEVFVTLQKKGLLHLLVSFYISFPLKLTANMVDE